MTYQIFCLEKEPKGKLSESKKYIPYDNEPFFSSIN